MELEEGRTLKFYSSAKRKTGENPFILYMSNSKTHGNSSNSGAAKRKKNEKTKGKINETTSVLVPSLSKIEVHLL